ncbi:tail fiber protein [Flavobacterium sp. CFBP9031]|uniref:tail fiber protein n=1 Tax=Flavobacterium sp. CFBP9031 TaxID=3096538 RepID=UPI002A6A1D1E|nr:tail fiber protein [Flavobacterium sp. CFBP9031]MDY0989671.1 tail fiber protein [Flavobacterium sp. CFBP9031]
MIKKILLAILIQFFVISINAQTAISLDIIDSRAMNDLPNFSSRSLRADFKQRSVVGAPGDGVWSTNISISPWANQDNTGDKNHQLNFNNGGIFYRNAFPRDTQWGGWKKLVITDENGNVGIGNSDPLAKLDVSGDLVLRNYENYGGKGSKIIFTAYGNDLQGPQIRSYLSFASGTNSRMGLILSSYSKGYQDELFLIDGNVGIGKANPTNKLDVKGTIHSQEVKVDMTGWSDFVFKKEYNLPTLEEVEKHIAEKGHLENIPSEEEVLKNGINLGEMNAKLLQKIEELTLYIIEQEKSKNKQSLRVEALEKENKNLKKVLERLSEIEEKLK